jgi:hypothetical protein
MKWIGLWTSLLILVTIMAFAEPKYTRGVGIYPGNPSEDFAPAKGPSLCTYNGIQTPMRLKW